MLTDKNSRRWIFEIATQKRLSLPVDAHWNGFISLSPAETEANRGVTRRASQLRFAIQHIHESFCSISRVDREGGGRGCLSRERESITSRVESGSSRNVTEKKKKKKKLEHRTNSLGRRSLLSIPFHLKSTPWARFGR